MREAVIEKFINYFLPGQASADIQTSDGVAFSAASTYLPDPRCFCREKVVHGEYDISGGGEFHMNFAYDDRGGAAEYVELLKDSRFNLKLRTTDTTTFGNATDTFYVFNYAGTADVDEIAQQMAADIGKTGPSYRAPVIDRIKQYPKTTVQGTCGFSVFTASDFIYVDSGDRCTDKSFADTFKPNAPFLGPAGTGSGSTTVTTHDSSNPYGLQCMACKGSGKCSTCVGTGKR